MAAIEALVLQLVDIGLPSCDDTIIQTVLQLFLARGSPGPFCCDAQKKVWNQEFHKAHPHRLSEDAETNEYTLPSAKEVRKWLSKLNEDMVKFHDVPADRVFFMQELNFFLDKQTREVKFHRMFHGGVHHCSNEKDTISILFVLGADGRMGPGMVIFPRMVIPEKLFASLRKTKNGQDWVLGSSLNGWLYGDCVVEFVSDAFVPWLKKRNTHFPIALFTNEYVSNLSLARMSDTFREQGIQLVTVPRKIASILSPAEHLVADYFRYCWGKAVYDWRASNDSKPLLEENFTPFLLSCLASQATPDRIRKRFNSFGICPFDTQAMFRSLIRKQ